MAGAAKKAAAKPRKAAASRAAKAAKGERARTKTQLAAAVAEATGQTKKDVAAVIEQLKALLLGDLRTRGVAALHGVVKLVVKMRAARGPRMMRNPQTGEPMMVAAKPASRVVKARLFKEARTVV